MISIIKHETVEAENIILPTQGHTGNKRLRQEMIPSLPMNKHLSTASQGKLRQSETSPKGWKSYNHKCASTNLPQFGWMVSSDKDVGSCLYRGSLDSP